MDYQLLTEIDICLDEMKDWENELELKWTSEQRMKYLRLKLETFQNFIAQQAEYWEKELSGTCSSNSENVEIIQPSNDDSERDRIAERTAAIQRAVAEKLAAEKAAIEKATAEKVAAQKAAAEKAAAEKIAAQKAAAEKAAAEKAIAEAKLKEKLAAEKAAAEKKIQKWKIRLKF